MKLQLKISILIWSLTLLYDPAYSQTFSNNLKFVKYSTAMGLSSNNQSCVVQDKQGFIWIGADEGLNRFDGQSFKIYMSNPKSNTSLKSNIIKCLFCDSNGQLWIGTYGGGLSKYNKEKDNFSTYDTSNSKFLLTDEINAIAEDKYKKLWVGTNNGLYQYDQKINGFIRYITQPDQKLNSKTVADNSINFIKQDDDIFQEFYLHSIQQKFHLVITNCLM